MYKCVVVVPVYKPFDELERLAFKQCLTVLSGYDIAIVQPHSFDSAGMWNAEFLRGGIKRLDDKWFKSVQSYNELMLQSDFYRLFEHYDYMLIYQLDAFAFRDELQAWADKGYDYIGAPWLPNRNLFQNTIGNVIRSVKNLVAPAGKSLRVSHANIHYRSGNGGFSLRRIAKMIDATTTYKSEINQIIASNCMTEDVFFSVYLRKKAKMRIPCWKEAIRFAVENNPEFCLHKNGGQLPFGCHYWSKGRYRAFWQQYIHD